MSRPPARAATSSSASGDSPRGPATGPAATAASRRASGGDGAGGRRATASSSCAEHVGPRLGVGHRARRVDLEVREEPLLRHGHLRRDARPRRRLVEPVARPQPRELLRRVAVHHDDPVEAQVGARLDDQRGVGHGHRGARCRPRRGPGRLGGAHARVHDRVEPRARRGVGEDDRAEGRPVEGAVRAEDPSAEGLGDRGEGGLARRHDVARDLVEVEGREAARGEPAQHVRLAARDAAGQPDPEHAAPRLRRLAPRARCWP